MVGEVGRVAVRTIRRKKTLAAMKQQGRAIES
jgi:hypothetical protein